MWLNPSFALTLLESNLGVSARSAFWSTSQLLRRSSQEQSMRYFWWSFTDAVAVALPRSSGYDCSWHRSPDAWGTTNHVSGGQSTDTDWPSWRAFSAGTAAGAWFWRATARALLLKAVNLWSWGSLWKEGPEQSSTARSTCVYFSPQFGGGTTHRPSCQAQALWEVTSGFSAVIFS